LRHPHAYRRLTILAMALALLAPSVLALPSVPSTVPPTLRPLVVDLSDGVSDAEADHLIRMPGTSAADLVRAAAAQMGYRRLEAPALPALPAEAPLAAALAALYEVGGTPYDPAELHKAVTTVDPRVQAPTARLVLALAEAGRLQQAATATLTLEDQWALVNGLHHDQWGPEWRAAADKVRVDLLAAGAVLLLETIEDAVPELQAATAAGVWPPGGFVDPAGLIHLGTEGDDEYRSRRWLYLDPGGNDLYTDLCNSGGADPLSDILLDSRAPIPIGTVVDIGGNDSHLISPLSPRVFQGAGAGGVGVLWDHQGSDITSGGYAGSGFTGVGVVHDKEGTDRRESASNGGGHGRRGIGILVDVSGNDSYLAGATSLASAADRGRGILRDEEGDDFYEPRTTGSFGFTADFSPPATSNATFADLGGGLDRYPTWSPAIKASNNNRWSDGRGGTGWDE